MANKRMFSKSIVDTDAFLDMPASSQLLYFHLAMRADDEGFIGNPKKIMRMCGFQEDDLKILLAKNFILSFNSGVVVIKHWLIHNTIRMDRFNKTNYEDEKKNLLIKENKAYTEIGKPNGNQMETQVKLSKVKLSKVSIAETSSAKPFSFKDKLLLMDNDKSLLIKVIAEYWRYRKITFTNQDQYQSGLKRDLRPAQRLKGYELDRIKEVMYYLNSQDFLTEIWTLETVHKYIDKDLNKLKEEYEKS